MPDEFLQFFNRVKHAGDREPNQRAALGKSGKGAGNQPLHLQEILDTLPEAAHQRAGAAIATESELVFAAIAPAVLKVA